MLFLDDTGPKRRDSPTGHNQSSVRADPTREMTVMVGGPDLTVAVAPTAEIGGIAGLILTEEAEMSIF